MLALFICCTHCTSFSQTPSKADTQYVIRLIQRANELSIIDIDSSRFYAEKSLQVSRQIKYPIGEANALERIGFYMDRNGDFRKAISYYAQAMKIKVDANHFSAGWPMGEIGICYQRLGVLDSALYYYERSVEWGRKNKAADYDVALGTFRKARLYYMRGNLPEAMSLSDESLSIGERINAPFVLMENYLTRSHIYTQLGDYDKALESCNQGITVTKTHPDKRMVADLNLQIGRIYLAKKEFEKAGEKYAYGLKIAKEINHGQGIISAIICLGDLNMELKQYEEALKNYNKAYGIARDLKIKVEQARALLKVGNAYSAMKQFSQAVAQGERSFQLARSLGSPFLQKNAAEMLWKAYRSQNNFQAALKYHELLKDLADSVSTTSFQKSLLEKQMNLKQANDSLRYVREKDVLKAEQEKKDARQRTTRNSLIVGLIGIMVLFLLVYRTLWFRRNQKYLKATVEKRTEQLRVSLLEKEALLKEIHHRVKNNLEVISSLLMLQTNSVKDQQAKDSLTEGQSRIQSIALIHHKLYRNDELGSVELKEFTVDLFKQVKDVFNKPGNRVEMNFKGDECWINTDKAVPLGLILNELFTNAFKYAVRPDMENRITITLNENGTAGTQGLSLMYSDNGPGMPEGFKPEKSASLGMKVIHLLTRQLEGSLHMYNNNGTVVEMQFPNKQNHITES